MALHGDLLERFGDREPARQFKAKTVEQRCVRLVPRDTPSIGKTLEVTLFDLPADTALMLQGWHSIAPAPLAAFGLPGCDLHIMPIAASIVSGSGGMAKYRMPIPDLPVLIGLHIVNQALVPDPSAGNGAGAVMSDAAEGVIGQR